MEILATLDVLHCCMLASVQMRAASLILYIQVAAGLELVAMSLGLKKHEEFQSSVVLKGRGLGGFLM